MTLGKLQNFHWTTLSSLITHSFIYSTNSFWLLTRCQYNSRYQEKISLNPRRLEANNQTNPIQEIPLSHPWLVSHQLLSVLHPEHILNPRMFQPLSTIILIQARAHKLRSDRLHRPSKSLMEPKEDSAVVSHPSSEPCLMQEWDQVFWATSTLCAKARRPRTLRRTSFSAWTWY